MIAYLNIFVKDTFKSLLDNSNIFFISSLAHVDCLFPGTLRFSWIFICWIIWFVSCTFWVIHWDFGSCLYLMEYVDIFVLTDLFWLGQWRMKKMSEKKNKWCFTLLSLSFKNSLFLSQARASGFLTALYLCTPNSHFWVSSYINFRPGNTGRGKKG